MTNPHATDAERLREEIIAAILGAGIVPGWTAAAADAVLALPAIAGAAAAAVEGEDLVERLREEIARVRKTFERCASGLVSEDYRTGYREAIEHVLEIPAIARAVAAPVEDKQLVADLRKLVHCIGQKCNPIKKRAADEIERLSARLSEARDDAVIAGIARDNALALLSDATRKRDEAVAAETEACARAAEAALHWAWFPTTYNHDQATTAVGRAIRARTAAPATATTEGGEE